MKTPHYLCLGFIAAIGILATSLCSILTGCSAAQQAQAQTVADQIGTDVVTYGKSLANMLQTINGIVQVSAPVAQAIASQWGLLPANSQQLAVFNQVVSASAKVATGSADLNNLLTAISTTGTVPATVTPAVPTTLNLRPPYREHDAYCVELSGHKRTINYQPE